MTSLEQEGAELTALGEELISLGQVLQQFTTAQANKLREKAEAGRHGWRSDVYWMERWRMHFDEHVAKVGTLATEEDERRNLVDIANIAMFGWWLIAECSGEGTHEALTLTEEPQ